MSAQAVDEIMRHLQGLRTMQAMAGVRGRKPGPPAGLTYAGVGDYVLDRHVPAPAPQALNAEQLDYLRMLADGLGPLRAKVCFGNSMSLLEADSSCEAEERLEYVEGFAVTGGFAVHHGWLLLDGALVDVTRSLRPEATQEFLDGRDPQEDLADRVLGVVPDAWAYVGVPLPRDVVLAYTAEVSSIGSRIDCYELRHDLLRQPRLNPAPDWEALTAPLRALQELNLAGVD